MGPPGPIPSSHFFLLRRCGQRRGRGCLAGLGYPLPGPYAGTGRESRQAVGVPGGTSGNLEIVHVSVGHGAGLATSTTKICGEDGSSDVGPSSGAVVYDMVIVSVLIRLPSVNTATEDP